MKICFYTTGDIKSLATMKRALGLAKPLNNLGWQVFIIAMDSEENRKRIALEAGSAKTQYFSQGNPLQEIKQKWHFLKKIKPDVVWVCSLGIRNFIIPKKYNILIEHSELGSAIPDNSGIKKQLIHFFEFISVYYSGIICASSYLVSHFEGKVKNRKLPIHYSPYAFNEEVISLPTLVLDELKQNYGEKTNFVYMGTVTRNYGVFTMLEAARVLKNKNINFQLFILGRGRHFEEAKNFVLDNALEDFVQMPGYIDEEHLSSYFELANAFISPLNDTVQDWARCPSKIYMYLPYNKPVLTCEIGEPKNIFGDKGFYFDNNNPETLALEMVKISESKESLSQINIKDHSWDKRALDFNNWYKEKF
jgi:glycosyltransferase involved in cell wall biosynthesis